MTVAVEQVTYNLDQIKGKEAGTVPKMSALHFDIGILKTHENLKPEFYLKKSYRVFQTKRNVRARSIENCILINFDLIIFSSWSNFTYM